MSLILFQFIFFQILLAKPNVNCSSAYCSNCTKIEPEKCFQCIDNFLLIDNKCIYKSEKHCEKTKMNYCIKCEKGYHLNDDTLSCEEGNDGCDEYNSESECTKCQQGYLFNETECILCEQNPYCIEFDSSCSECIKCNSEYALSNSTCISLIPHCKQYEKDKCVKCMNGYYFDKSGNCSKGEIDNCMEYQSKNHSNSHECIKCLNGYILEKTSQHCVKITNELKPSNCKEISDFNVCSICNEGYYLTKDSQCKACSNGCSVCKNETLCLTCSHGYYLRNITGKCVEIPNHDFKKCEYYSASKIECTLYNANCIYEIVNDIGYCSYKGLNCSSWSETNKCLQCDSGHVLNPENVMACKEKIEGCITYKNKTINNITTEVCVECNSNGYYLKEDFTCGKCDSICSFGKCEYSPTNCFEFNCTDVGCSKCSSDICHECVFENKVRNDWCGTDICVDYLSDGRCNLCLNYSYESYYDIDNQKYLPVTSRYYLPNEEGKCTEVEDQQKYDFTIFVIIIVVAFLLIFMIITLVIVIIILFYIKKHQMKSEYVGINEK